MFNNNTAVQLIETVTRNVIVMKDRILNIDDMTSSLEFLCVRLFVFSYPRNSFRSPLYVVTSLIVYELWLQLLLRSMN